MLIGLTSLALAGVLDFETVHVSGDDPDVESACVNELGAYNYVTGNKVYRSSTDSVHAFADASKKVRLLGWSASCDRLVILDGTDVVRLDVGKLQETARVASGFRELWGRHKHGAVGAGGSLVVVRGEQDGGPRTALIDLDSAERTVLPARFGRWSPDPSYFSWSFSADGRYVRANDKTGGFSVVEVPTGKLVSRRDAAEVLGSRRWLTSRGELQIEGELTKSVKLGGSFVRVADRGQAAGRGITSGGSQVRVPGGVHGFVRGEGRQVLMLSWWRSPPNRQRLAVHRMKTLAPDLTPAPMPVSTPHEVAGAQDFAVPPELDVAALALDGDQVWVAGEASGRLVIAELTEGTRVELDRGACPTAVLRLVSPRVLLGWSPEPGPVTACVWRDGERVPGLEVRKRAVRSADVSLGGDALVYTDARGAWVRTDGQRAVRVRAEYELAEGVAMIGSSALIEVRQGKDTPHFVRVDPASGTVGEPRYAPRLPDLPTDAERRVVIVGDRVVVAAAHPQGPRYAWAEDHRGCPAAVAVRGGEHVQLMGCQHVVAEMIPAAIREGFEALDWAWPSGPGPAGQPVASSPDGRWLAVAGGEPRTVRRWPTSVLVREGLKVAHNRLRARGDLEGARRGRAAVAIDEDPARAAAHRKEVAAATCAKGNCIDGTGKIRLASGWSYEGSFIEGTVSGHGTIRYPDGGRYVGEVLLGMRHGEGEYIGADGAVFAGDFHNNEVGGFGVYRTDDMEVDSRYSGGAQQGRATIRWKETGRWFEGEAVRGIPVRGTLHYPDGDSWTGGFDKAGEPHGPGRAVKGAREFDLPMEHGSPTIQTDWDKRPIPNLATMRKRVLEGCVEGDCRTGPGVTVYGKDTWRGTFDNGVITGQGRFEYASGAVYVGLVKYGNPHGRGRFEKPDGSYYEGDWVHGMRHGHGTSRRADGSLITGSFVNDKVHGQARVQYANGNTFQGEMSWGRRRYGTWTEPGMVWTGGFDDQGSLHGQGRLTLEGKTHDATFWHGEPRSEGGR